MSRMNSETPARGELRPRLKLRTAFALASVLYALTLFQRPLIAAEQLEFGPDLQNAGWAVIQLGAGAPAVFTATGRGHLEISTDRSAGLLWRALHRNWAPSHKAQWRWRVHEGPPAADLTTRGADDRALGVAFVFGVAARSALTPAAVLGPGRVTALVYVFGGNKSRGEILSSPHMGVRGRFIVLRPADAPKSIWFEEAVDLARDHLRVFGQPASPLVAVAIISDSDDTGTRNQVELAGLTLD